MRGHHVLSPCHAFITSAASREIREAVDAIRFSVGSEASDTNVREDRERTTSAHPEIVVLGPMNKLDAVTIVSAYGRVPRAFFQWFEELRSQLKDQQQMLEHCHFEEGWWAFDRW